MSKSKVYRVEDAQSYFGPYYIIRDADGKRIAEVGKPATDSLGDEANKTNARFIANALSRRDEICRTPEPPGPPNTPMPTNRIDVA